MCNSRRLKLRTLNLNTKSEAAWPPCNEGNKMDEGNHQKGIVQGLYRDPIGMI